ncbi:MAG: bifunctional adenosylcobinamide kinase/adenosylcobinamide-phosphate guanylyltransferase [Oscillospiraceae bacterium]|nr:bifunctional adenosylcobinamide kinase/adenosylcobinamide-phosphate guanylyltransferase [Oscillospiraceae bacterium]
MSGRLILVTGGSGSGKSAWAEKTLLAQAGGRAVYLAAMENDGSPEAAARVARHRAMRARHGQEAGLEFLTIERPVDVGGAAVEPGDSVLLEDLGNLLANEIWPASGVPSPAGAEQAEKRIFSGVCALLERVELLVVVSCDVFADGVEYDAETTAYIQSLANLHRRLAPLACQTVEVVCGIPIIVTAVEK